VLERPYSPRPSHSEAASRDSPFTIRHSPDGRARPQSSRGQTARLPNSLPPCLRSLPGIPFPRTARARRRDWLRRLQGWRVCREELQPLFHGGVPNGAGSKLGLDDLAGGARAVFFCNEWIETLLDFDASIHPPSRELRDAGSDKLRSCGWAAPLSISRFSKQSWLSLAARLRIACKQAGRDDDAIMREYEAAVRLMAAIAGGSHNGEPLHFDDVVSAMLRAIRDAAEEYGFRLECPPPIGDQIRIVCFEKARIP
jgi:hypothetical protein